MTRGSYWRMQMRIKVLGMLHAMRVRIGYTKEAHQWDEHYTTHVKHMGLSGS